MARQPIGTPAIGVAEVSSVSTLAASRQRSLSVLASALSSRSWRRSFRVRSGPAPLPKPLAVEFRHASDLTPGRCWLNITENFRDDDIETFRHHVSGRYTEGTLARLIESGTLNSRLRSSARPGTLRHLSQ